MRSGERQREIEAAFERYYACYKGGVRYGEKALAREAFLNGAEFVEKLALGARNYHPRSKDAYVAAVKDAMDEDFELSAVEYRDALVALKEDLDKRLREAREDLGEEVAGCPV